MIGAVITDASDQLLSCVILGLTDSIFSSWSTYRLAELLESLPPEGRLCRDEISANECELPFVMLDRETSIRVSIAKAKGERAIKFLVGTAREVLAASDLDSCALKEFRRQEYLGRQVDIRWYSENLEKMAGLADWTIWTGLPDPTEVGNRQLLITRSEKMLKPFVSRIHAEVRRFLSLGVDPTASKKNGGVVGIDFVDVQKELVFVASRNDL